MHPKVDEYLNNLNKWEDELRLLRKYMLECNLREEYKWMHPCYVYQGKNIAVLGEFKEYCSLSFFKGSLLKNEEKILERVGEHTQGSMVAKFKDIKDILKLEKTIKAYVFEAIEVEEAGLKIEYKTVDDYEMPEELKVVLSEDKAFKEAFENLTPGRQKGYLLHYSSAKQSKTRESRIEKSRERIFKGKGIDDCICGHSKRMPRCDGSHRFVTD